LSTEFVTLELSTAARPLTVEFTSSERVTLVLPLIVDRLIVEERIVAAPLIVLPVRVDSPETFALPFTSDPLSSLVTPDTLARPHTAESPET
jgi:hypothetical protein